MTDVETTTRRRRLRLRPRTVVPVLLAVFGVYVLVSGAAGFVIAARAASVGEAAADTFDPGDGWERTAQDSRSGYPPWAWIRGAGRSARFCEGGSTCSVTTTRWERPGSVSREDAERMLTANGVPTDDLRCREAEDVQPSGCAVFTAWSVDGTAFEVYCSVQDAYTTEFGSRAPSSLVLELRRGAFAD